MTTETRLADFAAELGAAVAREIVRGLREELRELPGDITEHAPLRRIAYDPDEVAEVLGVSRSYVYDLMSDGSIPFVQLGRKRLVLHDALVAALEGRNADEGDESDPEERGISAAVHASGSDSRRHRGG